MPRQSENPVPTPKRGMSTSGCPKATCRSANRVSGVIAPLGSTPRSRRRCPSRRRLSGVDSIPSGLTPQAARIDQSRNDALSWISERPPSLVEFILGVSRKGRALPAAALERTHSIMNALSAWLPLSLLAKAIDRDCCSLTRANAMRRRSLRTSSCRIHIERAPAAALSAYSIAHTPQLLGWAPERAHLSQKCSSCVSREAKAAAPAELCSRSNGCALEPSRHFRSSSARSDSHERKVEASAACEAEHTATGPAIVLSFYEETVAGIGKEKTTP
eukprot:scaffold182417_cov32-Tisochrysis_lutea.AAC.1